MTHSDAMVHLRAIAAQPKPQTGAFPAAQRRTDERLYVALFLTPRRHRAHLAALANLLTLARKIADNRDMELESKLAYIDSIEHAICHSTARHGYEKPAVDLRAHLQRDDIPDRYVRQILRAKRRDSVGARVNSWSDFLIYGRFAATPIGRTLLALHGEDQNAGQAMDALCIAFLALNCLIACRDDWTELGRCHIPQAWFNEAGISVERLVETHSDDRLRGVFDRYLDGVDRLLARCEDLPTAIRSRSLRRQVCVAMAIARSTREHLRHADPLGPDARPGILRMTTAALRGLAGSVFRR